MAGRRRESPGRAHGWVTAAAVVVVVLLLLPVLLLPLTTSVPIWAWLPLLALGLGALVWLVAGRRRRWVRPAAVGVVAIAAVGAVIRDAGTRAGQTTRADATAR